MKAPPLIHIGYHKAGSTWLQTVLFGMPRDYTRTSADPGRRPNSLVSPWSRRDIARILVGGDSFSFDADSARRFFSPGIESAASASLVPVISHERLSGLLSQGGYDSKTIADRLAEVFPTGRILIVIREQSSMIASHWKGYVQRGGSRSIRQYVAQLMSPGGGATLFPACHCEYDKLIAYYQGLFGENNVRTLPFEMLVRDPDQFAIEVATFAGVRPQTTLAASRVNPSLSALAIFAKRLLNMTVIPTDIDRFPPSRINERLLRVVRGADRMVLRRFSRSLDQRIRVVVVSKLGDRYATSNRSTVQLTGIDLSGYGYKC